MKMPAILIYELLLIFASVLIFRGMWAIMDRVPSLNSDLAHIISLCLGVAMTVVALIQLNLIIKNGKN